MSDPQSVDPQPVDLSAIVKAYDVRGVADHQLTEEVARALGAAYADFLDSGALIVAHDMRISSPRLAAAFTEGAVRRGSIVAEAGLSSTDQLYCASGLHRAAGAMVTASHNPAADNGLKLCLSGARPLSRDTGLDRIRRGAQDYLAAGEIPTLDGGRAEGLETLDDYARTLLGLVRPSERRPLRVVVDAANAMAGLTVPAVFERLEHIELIPLFFELDGTFPNHPADPLDRENLAVLRETVLEQGADLGLAFDGDADRCVVLDEAGIPVPPSAITALIAEREIARARAAGEHQPAVVANLVSSRHVGETITAAGGREVRSPVGHSLIKALMAEHGAVFGGEHSAHYYFRDFFHADSGMLAALHVLAALAEIDGPLSELVADHDPYPSSGEVNSRVADPAAALERVRAHVAKLPDAVTDELDGLTIIHWDEQMLPENRWWVSLRASNTEPLLRLNVEAAQETTMTRVRDEILALARDEETVSAAGAGPAAPTSGALLAGASGADVPGWVRAQLRCPECLGELRDVQEALQCQDCSRLYAVSGGIPVLIASQALKGTERTSADSSR